ncbi:hypothetical protein LIPSTDRAFT_1213, partial [Lipomyces starkeyi NRRL Y-11557]
VRDNNLQQQPQQKQQQKCIPKPFWNDFSAQVSQQLWLPSSSLDGNEWGSETIAHDWANCLRWTSGVDAHDDLSWSVDENEAEQSAKRPQLSQSAKEPKRYRLYPTAEEKKILVEWIGAARWTYNVCLRAIMDEGVPRSKKALRARAINEEAIELLKKPWLEETPYDIRDAAMDDLLRHLRREQLGTRTIRRRFRSRTALDKGASKRASSSTAGTGCGAVGSTPFFST